MIARRFSKRSSSFRIRGFNLMDAITGSKSGGEKKEVETKVADAKTTEKKPASQSTEDGDETPKNLADVVAAEIGRKPQGKKTAHGGVGGDDSSLDNVEPNLDPEQKVTGKGIARKFNLYSETITGLENEKKALVAEIAALKKENESLKTFADIENNEKFKVLKSDHDKVLETLEVRSLADSPRFREKYTNKRQQILVELAPFFNEIGDENKRNEIVVAVDSVVSRTPPGKNNDPAFIKGISNAIGDSVDPEIKFAMKQKLGQVRELINGEYDALCDWQKTKQQLGNEEIGSRESAATASVKALDGLRLRLAQDNPGRKEFLEKAGLSKDYNDLVEGKIGFYKSQIEKSAKAGVITPEVLELAHLGMEFPFQAHVNSMMKNLVIELNGKLSEKDKLIAELKGSSTGGSKDAESGGGGDGKKKSLVDFVRDSHQ